MRRIVMRPFMNAIDNRDSEVAYHVKYNAIRLSWHILHAKKVNNLHSFHR